MQNIQKSILNMVMQKWLNSDYLIIDTETTGLDNNAEVIEIAIINMHGDVLLNSLIKPTCSIPAAVTKINNITDEMVADAPLWRDVFPVILNIIDGKKWLAWNSKFDARLIIQTGIITGYFEDLPASKILDIAAKINDSQIDAKAVYDQWYGEFDSKRNNFKRQSLATAAERHNVSVNGAHRALADCMMVLGVLNAVCHSDYAVFEARYAELVADNDKAMEAMKQANEAVKLAHSKFSKLAAENARLKAFKTAVYQQMGAGCEAPEFSITEGLSNLRRFADTLHAIEREFFTKEVPDEECKGETVEECPLAWGMSVEQYVAEFRKCLAEVRESARNEGINYAASRLAAAFNHGFIDKPVAEVLDVTRMILSAKEDLANDSLPAADGLFGEYAEKAIEEWAAQLRKGVQS
ncbi:3'-5' exonuclease [Salmonella enterica]|nr:3'-5' exonuclease [Salmonella enterica]